MLNRVNAGVLAEEVTRTLEREWRSSRPHPRAWAMGLKEDPDTPAKRRQREIRKWRQENPSARQWVV